MNGAGLLVLAAAKSPQQVLAETAGGFLLLAVLVLLLVALVVGLGALSAALGALLPDRVRAAARCAGGQPVRATLLGAIDVVGGLVVAALLAQVPPLGIAALLLLASLAALAGLGLAGLAWRIAARLHRGEEPGPLQCAAGGALLAAGFLVPVLGQAVALLCLFCGVGSAASAMWERSGRSESRS